VCRRRSSGNPCRLFPYPHGQRRSDVRGYADRGGDAEWRAPEPRAVLQSRRERGERVLHHAVLREGDMNSVSQAALLVIAAGAFTGQAMWTVEAQQPLAPRIAAADKGPSKIDISSYPPEMQKVYPLFTRKCGLCHSVARVINSDYVLEGDW